MKKLLALCLTVVLCLCCLASCGITGFRSISYQDADTERLLMDGYAPKRAKPGDIVVLRTGPIMDANLDLYANGVKLDNTHNDSDYWEYIFTMPDEDVVITHDIIGGFGYKECVNHIDENKNERIKCFSSPSARDGHTFRFAGYMFPQTKHLFS
ncbi:MAG: hypothetical protein IJF39_04940 [Clostridia bacterium]|nr:hypothetical protein [Clostridia bacterium]